MADGGSVARPEVAVGAVVVRDGRLLLVQRARGVAAGRWAEPSGRVDAGETLAAAVLRELREETGLAGAVGPLCGIAEVIGDGWHYVIIDFWVEVAPDAEPIAGDDAAAVAWATRDDLAALPLVDDLVTFLEAHAVLPQLR